MVPDAIRKHFTGIELALNLHNYLLSSSPFLQVKKGTERGRHLSEDTDYRRRRGFRALLLTATQPASGSSGPHCSTRMSGAWPRLGSSFLDVYCRHQPQGTGPPILHEHLPQGLWSHWRNRFSRHPRSLARSPGETDVSKQDGRPAAEGVLPPKRPANKGFVIVFLYCDYFYRAIGQGTVVLFCSKWSEGHCLLQSVRFEPSLPDEALAIFLLSNKFTNYLVS